MPERSFRILIRNDSSYLSLNQSFNHLCGGVYTSGWLPPVTIAPGSVGGVQAESDGFATGTEGYVKYDVNGPDGKHGMIYAYWDNPFLGVTQFRYATDAVDVPPDCDYSGPSNGGSMFSTKVSLDFTINFMSYAHGLDAGGDITQPGDLVVYGTGPDGGLGELLGVLGIDENPVLELELVDAVQAPPVSPPELFGQSEPPTHSVLADATLEDWTGSWHNGTVRVDIELEPGQLPEEDEVSGTVYDGTVDPPLQFSETFVPGPVGLLTAQEETIASLVAGQAQDQEQRFAFSHAAKAVLELAAKTPLNGASAAGHFEALAGKATTPTPQAVSLAKARSAGRAIGVLLQNGGGAAYLSHSVALFLFGVFDSKSGDKVGTELHYERLDRIGKPIVTVVLTTAAPLR
ncbi:MAG: hypothetical protein JO181_13710 [Solirubrobacterales bacterium]|nr:hypothetical protein [Solirubrobacterales bacterium]